MNGVLAGVRVLDFGRFIAGPLCAALLGDMGADVVRIERLSGGEDRNLYPVTDGGDGAAFLQYNRNKRGMTLNPMKPEGQEVLKRLVATADVVVANMPAEALAQMGLDYQSLTAIKPDIILVALSAFGESGPYRDRTGFDGVGQAMCGAAYLSGFPDQPIKSNASWVDSSTGLYGAIGTLAAILEKGRTGRGQQVSANLFSSAISFFNLYMIEQALIAPNRVATGNRSQSTAPSDIVPTRDGWIMIQTVGQAMFERWAGLMGEPHWLTDPRYATDILRAGKGSVISARTADWSRALDTASALKLLENARIPAAPVYSPQAVLDDAHVRETALFTPMAYPGTRTPVPMMMDAINLSETPLELRCRPPMLGEHTDAILGEIGFGPDDIKRFQEVKAV